MPRDHNDHVLDGGLHVHHLLLIDEHLLIDYHLVASWDRQSVEILRPDRGGSGAPINVAVPRRSADAPIEVPIPAALIPDFPVGKQVTGSEIAMLGEDVLQPLSDTVQAYLVDHPGDYPDLTGFVGLQWAMRVSS